MPCHVRVRRQAGCSVPFRRRMVGLACFVAVQAREGWRSAGGYRRAIVGIDGAGAEQIGQMLTSAFANRLPAAAEEPPTAQ